MLTHTTMRTAAMGGLAILAALTCGCAPEPRAKLVKIPTRATTPDNLAAVCHHVGFIAPQGYRIIAVWTGGHWLRTELPATDPIYLTRIRVGKPMLAEAVRQ